MVVRRGKKGIAVKCREIFVDNGYIHCLDGGTVLPASSNGAVSIGTVEYPQRYLSYANYKIAHGLRLRVEQDTMQRNDYS